MVKHSTTLPIHRSDATTPAAAVPREQRGRRSAGRDKGKLPARRCGRPTTYSRAVEDQVLDRMLTGQPLRAACRAVGVSAATFLTWVQADRNGISERYARAREACFDAMAEAIIDLADDDSRDVVINDEGKEVERPLRVNRARLQIDSRKWLLAKAMPKKYGNRVELESQDQSWASRVTIIYQNTPEAEDLTQQDEVEEKPQA